MVKAALTRTCAYQPCSTTFYLTDPRQRYCDYDCKQDALAARRIKTCVQCRAKPSVPPERFCSNDCRDTYAQTKHPGRKPRGFVAITVLLPAGCNPIRSVALPVAPESTQAIGGGQTYGEIARRVWCRRYARCLAHAVSKNWQGFECTKCDIDEPDINAPRPKGTNWEW